MATRDVDQGTRTAGRHQRELAFFTERIGRVLLIPSAVAVIAMAQPMASGEDPTSLTANGITDPTLVIPPQALPLQTPGASFLDPAFGTSIRRVSRSSDSGDFETQIYSQLQAFSADDTYLLTEGGSQGYLVRRVRDLGIVQGLDLSDINVPRWHPTQPHVLVHFDTNTDDDVDLQFTNVDTGVTSTVATLPGLNLIYGNQSFDELSRDGRWLAGMARRSGDGEPVVFAYDMISRTFGARLPLPDLYDGSPCSPDPQWGQVWPDWIAPSPLGRYLVIQWPGDGTQGCRGMETYDIRTGAFVGRPYDSHQHGDLGITADGREFFMTYEMEHPSGRLAIGYRWLPGPASGTGSPTYLLVMGWQGAHISCQGPPGSCLITTSENPYEADWQPLEAELFLLSLDGSVLRLAHHRSTECGYWVQPRATISVDGRYVAFASDWGRGRGCANDGLGEGDPYIIDLNAGGPPPNRAPWASAGGDRTVEGASRASLDGSGSSDPDGDAITYRWEQVSGSPVSLTGATTATPAFTAPSTRGTLVFKLTVSDGSLSSSDQVTITVAENGTGEPSISRVTSKKWKPGTPATINGANFTSDSREVEVQFGAYQAKIKSSTTTSIKVTIPRRLRSGATVSVYAVVRGRTSNSVQVRIR